MFLTGTSFNVLYTRSVKTTHDFYRRLGLEVKQLEADKVVISLGSFDLHFILHVTEPFESYRYIAESGDYGQGVIFYIETDDINKARDDIKLAGGVIKADVFKNHWGCDELLFEDPNGYKFALYQELKG